MQSLGFSGKSKLGLVNIMLGSANHIHFMENAVMFEGYKKKNAQFCKESQFSMSSLRENGFRITGTSGI